MREVNWDEIFQRRQEEAPERDRALGGLVWEDWLTLGIAAVVFMSVVASIDGAGWVDDMPSLYPVGFSALLIGYLLSRVRINELALHPIALFAGATLVFLQLLAVMSYGSVTERTDRMVDRMHAWWSAVTQGGISADPLPFIVLMLVLVWLGTYISAWSIFRWRNPWLALVPAGTALMWNISFIPGQFSNAFVVFLFASVLLLMRLHLARKEREWERAGVIYPEFISLSALHLALWAAVGIVVVALLFPMAERSDTAHERWNDFTSPIVERLEPFARVFISINAKKPITIHSLTDALPFQGKVSLSNADAVEVNVQLTPEMAAFLRGRSFDEYTSEGWKMNVEGNVPLPAGAPAALEEPAVEGVRQQVTVNVTVEGGNNDLLYSLGQPMSSDVDSEARVGDIRGDIMSLKPGAHLSDGDTYSVTGSVNVASVDQLRDAGTNYPGWVLERYLAVPDGLPERVASKAFDVTRSTGTPYDKAVALESYLRTFPEDFDIEATPPGRDAVDFFLFDLQRGYFDYHASAMAVMLRTLGVPSRVAVGYVIDPAQREGESDTFRLIERNAFAWPEVYFPGIGWVEFNPTPSEPPVRRPGMLPTTPPALGPDGEGVPGEPPLPRMNPAGPSTSPSTPVSHSSEETFLPPMLVVAFALGALAIAAAGGGRLVWQRGMAGLSRPAQLWEKSIRLSSIARTSPLPSETPREFAARLSETVPGTHPARYIAGAYERARFAQTAAEDERDERLEAAWSAVRAALLRRILRLRPPSSE